MAINTLPLEIIQEITLKIDDIFTLENWLAVYKGIQYSEKIKVHRIMLTILQNNKYTLYSMEPFFASQVRCSCYDCINYRRIERKVKYMIEYKFFGRSYIKRNGKVIKKKHYRHAWKMIRRDTDYYKFLRIYKDIWFY